MMKVVCAWCQKDMGEKMGPDGSVTHGICPECAAKEKATPRDTSRWCKNCGEKIPFDSPPEVVLCNGCWHDMNDEDMHPQSEEEGDEQGRAEEERQLADDIRRF